VQYIQHVLTIIVPRHIHAHFADELYGSVLVMFLEHLGREHASLTAYHHATTTQRKGDRHRAVADRPLRRCGFAIRLGLGCIIDIQKLRSTAGRNLARFWREGVGSLWHPAES
jgi:hypothetical protein